MLPESLWIDLVIGGRGARGEERGRGRERRRRDDTLDTWLRVIIIP